MPLIPSRPDAFVQLTLADGQQWLLCPTDPEAADVIQRLSKVMNLATGKTGREIFVSVREGVRLPFHVPDDRSPVICLLPVGENDAMKVIQMLDLAKTIALCTIPQGGLLLHGALVEKEGSGVILAGPGGVGKSTASQRIPLPWHALCDDATFVIPDGKGRFCAHPWPTWSRFYDNGPCGIWDVEKAVPLHAIFFLNQATEDSAGSLAVPEATAYLIESIHQVLGPPVPGNGDAADSKGLCSGELSAVTALVQSVPVHLLHISLTGQFWTEVERELETEHTVYDSGSGPASGSGPSRDYAHRIFVSGSVPVVYTGPSMNPVLQEPDLLEVCPYGSRAIRIGDVICFHSPAENKTIVHRIRGISTAGIRTQGDNNPLADPALVQPEQITGQVIAALREKRPRNIAGGSLGRVTRLRSQLRRNVLIGAGILYRIARPILICTRAVFRSGSFCMRQRIVLFSARNQVTLRLYLGNRLVGVFHSRKKGWFLRFPFQLVVDVTELPVVEKPRRLPVEPGSTLQNFPLPDR
ncbi:MAG: SynChlorMet cassette protein ScmC [Methanoregula sp.]